VTIEAVSQETAGSGATAVPYCLVKVLVPQAIHIWVGLPMSGKWNGRWQSVGGGGYVGAVSPPAAGVLGGYAGATTDTGHVGGRPDLPVPPLDGSFGMLSPGVPNTPCASGRKGRSEGSCPVRDVATRNLHGDGNRRLWYGNTRGTDLTGLGGFLPFPIATEQPKFWVYFDPTWDWHVIPQRPAGKAQAAQTTPPTSCVLALDATSGITIFRHYD
jgi:hypothetical protein